MTTPEPKFDAELAWDLQEWTRKVAPHHLDREECKELAAFLTEKGYSKGKTGGLGSLLSTIEEAGAKLVDELGPLADQFRKKT